MSSHIREFPISNQRYPWVVIPLSPKKRFITLFAAWGKQLLEKLSKKIQENKPIFIRAINHYPREYPTSDYAARQNNYRRCLQAEFPIFVLVFFRLFFFSFFTLSRLIKSWIRAINQADNEIDCDNPGMGADRQIKNVFARHNQQIEIDCVIIKAMV